MEFRKAIRYGRPDSASKQKSSIVIWPPTKSLFKRRSLLFPRALILEITWAIPPMYGPHPDREAYELARGRSKDLIAVVFDWR